MTVLLFTSLNFGIGVAFGILGFMACYHLAQGYRFNPTQEQTVLRIVAVTFGCFCVNFMGSSLLGTLQNYARLEVSLPALAVIPLVAKLFGGIGAWVLIFWVMGRFYPTQQRKS